MPKKPVSRPASEPVSAPTGSVPISQPIANPINGSHDSILPVVFGPVSALSRPRRASRCSSACSAAARRVCARGAPVVSFIRKHRPSSRMRSRLCARRALRVPRVVPAAKPSCSSRAKVSNRSSISSWVCRYARSRLLPVSRCSARRRSEDFSGSFPSVFPVCRLCAAEP